MLFVQFLRESPESYLNLPPKWKIIRNVKFRYYTGWDCVFLFVPLSMMPSSLQVPTSSLNFDSRSTMRQNHLISIICFEYLNFYRTSFSHCCTNSSPGPHSFLKLSDLKKRSCPNDLSSFCAPLFLPDFRAIIQALSFQFEALFMHNSKKSTRSLMGYLTR